MGDFEVAAGLAAWDAGFFAADIGGVAASCSIGASAGIIADELLAAPAPVEREVSEAFELVQLELTVRVGVR